MTLEERVKGLEGRVRSYSLAVIFFCLVGAAGLAITVMVISKLDARDKRDDAQSMEQRTVQHECSVPALPGQHHPEPKRHVHECWEQGLGSILTSVDRAVQAAETTSGFIAGCLNPEEKCGRLTAEQRMQEAMELNQSLAALKAELGKTQEELLSRTTFVVTSPNEPGTSELTVRPIIAASPSLPPPPACQETIGVGNQAVLPGVLCTKP
jgi:hypothetical protein